MTAPDTSPASRPPEDAKANTERTRKRKRRRRIFSLALLLVVVVTGLVASRTGWLAREVGRVVRVEVRRATGLELTYRRIGFSWRHMAVEADDVIVARPGQPAIARIDTLDVRPSFAALFRRQIRIAGISVDGGSIDLRFHGGQLVNGPTLQPQPQQSHGPPELPFRDIAISDLHVHLAHDQLGTLDLPSVDVDVRNTPEHRILFGLLAQSGSITGSQCFHGAITRVEARAEVSNWNLLRVALVRVEGAGIALRVHEADVPFSLEHGIDLDRTIHAAVDLSAPLAVLTCPVPFPRFAPHPHGDVSVSIDASATLRGLMDADNRRFRASGSIRTRNLALEMPFPDGTGRLGLGDDNEIRFEANEREVRIPYLSAHHSGGTVVSPGTQPRHPLVVDIHDLAHPVVDGHLDVSNVELRRLVHELSITEFAKVQWSISASADLHGELWRFGEPPDPHHPALLFEIAADTHDFAILRDFWMMEPQFPVISIGHASITGQIAIDAQHVRFQRLAGAFGQNNRSHVQVDSVTLRTAHDPNFPDVWIQNGRGEGVNLEDIGRVAAFPISGMATFTAQGGGQFADPLIAGEAHLRDFHYNELPLGDYDTHPGAQWRLRGMRVDVAALDARAGRSTFSARNAYLDFSRWVMSAGVHIASDNFYLRDYYHMFKFENDPVWEAFGGQTMPRCTGSARARNDVPCVDANDPGERESRRTNVPAGTTTGHIESEVSFVLGRPGDDPGGVLDVELWGRNLYLTGFDEAIDHADLHYRYTWLQRSRGFRGARHNLEFVRARYAGGAIQASGNIDLGGQMHFVGNVHDVRLPETNMAGRNAGGTLNASGSLEGQPDGQRWNIDGDVRGLNVASRNLGEVFFHVRSRPDGARSSDPRARPPRLYWSMDANALNGGMRIAGGLMVPWRTTSWRDVDGEVHPDWDRDWSHSLVDGHVEMTRAIDLVPLLPARVAARLGSDAHAIVRARVDIEHGVLGDLDHADARLDVSELDVGAQGLRLALSPTENLAACVHDGAVWIEQGAARSFTACARVPAQVLGRSAARGDAALSPAHFIGPEGTQLGISGGGTLAGRLGVTLDGRVDLARIAQLAPGVTWARGTGNFMVQATGTTANPQLRGTFELHHGALAASMLPDPVEDIDLLVRLDGNSVVLDRAVASLGASSINLTGGLAHLQGFDLDRLDVPVRVQNLSLVPTTGVEVALDANTRLLWNPGEQLPLFSGDVTLTRVRYTRPVNLSQDQSGETRVAGSDSAETPYNPDNDHVRINLTIHARDSIRVANNIADAEIRIAENERPFRVAGTDGRLGVLGTLVIPRGRVILPLFRGTDFEISNGRVEFDNPDRIQPNFDVNARTDVRRGADAARNQWRVALHAYGTPDRFSLDMSSEPSLSREDIVLLLTFGATRAELDQAGAGNVGQAIAVQAIASATGIDRTVRQAIPVIDDFRIGSAYSPSQGRTVPQVAIGRRVNDRVRVGATVNTTEQREMRATVDVRVTNHTSVQLGYDNINDQGSSQIGNLGADLRWRLEFE